MRRYGAAAGNSAIARRRASARRASLLGARPAFNMSSSQRWRSVVSMSSQRESASARRSGVTMTRRSWRLVS
jgi:hypothetical protein